MSSTNTPSDSPSESKSPNEQAEQAWADHPENPFNWPEKKKWRLVLASAAVTLLVGLNATAVATPGHDIAVQFNVTDAPFPNSFWPVTVWTMAGALGPMILLPLFENFGTRTGYLVRLIHLGRWSWTLIDPCRIDCICHLPHFCHSASPRPEFRHTISCPRCFWIYRRNSPECNRAVHS